MSNQKGYSLIEGIIAVGLFTIVSLGGVTFARQYQRVYLQNQATESIDQYRQMVFELLHSSDSLARVSGLVPNLSVPNINCFKTLKNCSAASTAFVDFSIADTAGNFITRHDLANYGFGKNLLSCTTYPSAACPFRLNLSWRSLCNGARAGSCVNPQIVIRGQFQRDPNNTLYTFPMAAYNFSNTLGNLVGSYEQSCSSVGGVYIADTPPRCELPSGGVCPNDAFGNPQMVVGFNRLANTMVCRPYLSSTLNGNSCANGQVVMGADSNGNPVCANIVAAPLPGPTPVPFCDKTPTDPLCNLGPISATPDGAWTDGGCGGPC